MKRWPVLMLAPLAMAASSHHDPLEGRVEGPPQQCIELTQLGGMQIVGPDLILYVQSSHRTWAQHPVGGCKALRWDAKIVGAEEHDRRVCAGEQFGVTPAGSLAVSGTCAFGPFIPYDKVPKTQ